jgi:hypothetical protein
MSTLRQCHSLASSHRFVRARLSVSQRNWEIHAVIFVFNFENWASFPDDSYLRSWIERKQERYPIFHTIDHEHRRGSQKQPHRYLMEGNFTMTGHRK